MNRGVRVPGSEAVRAWALAALERYFPHGRGRVESLPVPIAPWPREQELPPRTAMVELPAFADHAAADGGLLAPAWAVVPGEGPAWKRTDWLSAAAWHLGCAAEREHERRHGPIHSYSLHLKGWDPRLWDRAWVNRIGLFLRAWAAAETAVSEEAMGPLPEAACWITHDVDYLAKTPAVRLKQGAFELFKAGRFAMERDARKCASQLGRAARFAFSLENYDLCREVAREVWAHGLKSSFFFYGGAGGRLRRPVLQLIDPSYDVAAPRWSTLVRELKARGFGIGLHQSYGSWGQGGQPGPMSREKARVEEALGSAIVSCRQHWLRFSWRDTWQAQSRSGLRLDLTLGFNDRPGFRNGAALAVRPLDPASGEGADILAAPMLFMDSHFFDYAGLDDGERETRLRHWLEELRSVRGVASVLWHPYVLSPDYGRAGLFGRLLDTLEGMPALVDLPG